MVAREHPQISTVFSHAPLLSRLCFHLRCALPLCCLGALWPLPARRTCGNLESAETEKSLRKVQESLSTLFLDREP